MPAFTEIVRSVSTDKFSEIFGASTRKAREAYFHRHGIRKPKKSNRLASLSKRGDERALHLYQALLEKEDEEMVEEVLRTWLLGKRAMLATALDHLGIAHDDGLTESDEVDEAFSKMSPGDLKALYDKLCQDYPAEDVKVYLRFMGASGVENLAA